MCAFLLLCLPVHIWYCQCDLWLSCPNRYLVTSQTSYSWRLTFLLHPGPPLCCGDKSRKTVASVAPRLPAPVCTGVGWLCPPCRLRERQTQVLTGALNNMAPPTFSFITLLRMGRTGGTWEEQNFHSFLCPVLVVPLFWQNP